MSDRLLTSLFINISVLRLHPTFFYFCWEVIVTENELTEKFANDLNEICQDLIDNFNLKHEQEVQSLAEPLLRWADFRLRYIDPKPRTIVASSKFPACVQSEAKPGFEKFISEVISGADLNVFQGIGLSVWNDISGKKPQSRTDLLWAEWGILHFHLTSSPPHANKYYVPRSDWLLFAIPTNNELGLIDIRSHEKAEEADLFEDTKLVEVAVRCWPDYFSELKLNGGLPSENSFSSEGIKKLRKAGITIPIVVDSVTYAPPGGGITTASTPVKINYKAAQIKRSVRQLAIQVANPRGRFQSKLIEMGVNSAEFRLGLTPRGFGVLEEQSNICLLLPSNDQDFQVLQDFLAPKWVCSRLPDYVPDLGYLVTEENVNVSLPH